MDHLEFEGEEVKNAGKLTKRAVIIDLLAGTVAGITSTVAGYPLDLIKFRLQISPSSKIRDCVRDIYRQGGLRAFLRGVWSPALGNIPINALIFASNGVCNKYLERREEMGDSAKIYVSGCIAGFVSLIAFVPTELIKIRIQDQHGSEGKDIYREVTRDIYRKAGLMGFYRGFWPQFWRDVPTYGIYFLSYNKYQ